MNTTINERFNLLIDALRQNVRSFALSINKSYTAIENTCKGRTKPGYDILDAVLNTYPQVSPEWLMKGEGEMFRSATQSTSPIRQDDYLLDHLKVMEDNFSRLSNQMEVKDKQIETKDQQIQTKDQQIAFLQRMLEGALPGKPNDVATDRSVTRTHPATERLAFAWVDQA